MSLYVIAVISLTLCPLDQFLLPPWLGRGKALVTCDTQWQPVPCASNSHIHDLPALDLALLS